MSATVGPSRWLGSLPKIGIRPAIDGRFQGVRESLEEPTMALAHAVADLLTANLRHPNGQPVECVIADSNIGGVAEAAACAEKFARAGVGLSITVTPCWCYGSETMDMDPFIPKAVWGFNGTERPGAVYLAAVLAAHNQKGLPAFSIYGHDVQDTGDTNLPEDVKEKLLRFARAGLAAATMRGKSYLSMGGVSMGIAGSIVDQPFFESYLGMRVEVIDSIKALGGMKLELVLGARCAPATMLQFCVAGSDQYGHGSGAPIARSELACPLNARGTPAPTPSPRAGAAQMATGGTARRSPRASLPHPPDAPCPTRSPLRRG